MPLASDRERACPCRGSRGGDKTGRGVMVDTWVWNSWGLGVASSGLGPGGLGGARPANLWPLKLVFQASVDLASSFGTSSPLRIRFRSLVPCVFFLVGMFASQL